SSAARGAGRVQRARSRPRANVRRARTRPSRRNHSRWRAARGVGRFSDSIPLGVSRARERPMIVVFDVGNSEITIGIFEQEELISHWRLTTAAPRTADELADRKSTRLNSSHDQTSYAVFCLKKKNNGPQA